MSTVYLWQFSPRGAAIMQTSMVQVFFLVISALFFQPLVEFINKHTIRLVFKVFSEINDVEIHM